MRFDVVLFELRLYKSRSQASAAIHDGAARLNGRPVKPSQEVRAGDRITLEHPSGSHTYRLADLPRASLTKEAARALLIDAPEA
jgi:ribosomal 50S subunit-recycling heat shock protein